MVIGARPRLARCSAATIVGTTAATRRPWAARSSGGMSISGRRRSSSAAIEMAARTPPSVAPRACANGSSTGSTDCGQAPRRRHRVTEAGGLGRVRQVADRHEVPDLLEAAGAGEGRRVVPAVVVVAGLAVDVADGGVGHGHAVQARGYLDQDGHGSILGSSADAINVDPINVDWCATMPGVTRFVGADEAARQLGVQKATLYAYVSRGLIQRRVAVDGRTSLYSAADLDALLRARLDVGTSSLDPRSTSRSSPGSPCSTRPASATAATTSPSWPAPATSSRSPSCCGPARSPTMWSSGRRRSPTIARWPGG